MARAERLLRAQLYVKPSQLRRYCPRSKAYNLEIGNGLFSSRPIASGVHILSFVGEFLNDPLVIRDRMQRGKRGGYLLGNSTCTAALDCFETCQRGQCLASFANCPLHCHNVVKGRMPIANARLVIRVVSKGHYEWSLASILPIAAHDEILWNYGVGYKYPDMYD